MTGPAGAHQELVWLVSDTSQTMSDCSRTQDIASDMPPPDRRDGACRFAQICPQAPRLVPSFLVSAHMRKGSYEKDS